MLTNGHRIHVGEESWIVNKGLLSGIKITSIIGSITNLMYITTVSEVLKTK